MSDTFLILNNIKRSALVQHQRKELTVVLEDTVI